MRNGKKSKSGFYRTLKTDGGIPIKTWVEDAKSPVVVRRAALDFVDAKEANPAECGVAKCMLRLHSAFPHPVKGVNVLPTVAYVFTKMDPNKGDYRAVRYRHGDGEAIRKFDEGGIIAEDKDITFYPVTRKGLGKAHSPGGGGDRTGKKHKYAARGINGRLTTYQQFVAERQRAAMEAVTAE